MNNRTIFKTTHSLPEDARKVWLLVFADSLKEKFLAKFRAGQVEHAGDLGAVPVSKLLDEIWAEQLDLISYIAEIKRRMEPIDARDTVVLTRRQLAMLIRLAKPVDLHDSEELEIIKQIIKQ